MIKETVQKTAIAIFEGTLNAFKDAALDGRNKFTDEQRNELVAIIDKAYDKQNLEASLTKIKAILSDFGAVYEKHGGDITIIHKNMINIKRKARR